MFRIIRSFAARWGTKLTHQCINSFRRKVLRRRYTSLESNAHTKSVAVMISHRWELGEPLEVHINAKVETEIRRYCCGWIES